MRKGNADGALRLLKKNMLNGILPLTNEIRKMLKQKHPKPNETTS